MSRCSCALQLLWAPYCASSAWRSAGVIDACAPASPPPLAAQHADRIMPLVAGAVEPSLERGDAEADRRAGARVAPFARGQLLQSRAQRALRRRRRQKRADNREAQPRPTLMHPRSASFRHARPPKNERDDGKRPHRGAATRILCGSAAPVRKRASPMRRRSAARGSAARTRSCSFEIAGEPLEQRDRQCRDVDRRHHGGHRDRREGAVGEGGTPPGAPARQRPPIKSGHDRQPRQAGRRGAEHASPRSTSPRWRGRRAGPESAATAGWCACGSHPPRSRS